MLNEIQIVAATLYAECEGEPWAGKVMVGEVMAVRASERNQTLKTICLAPKQFTAWNDKTMAQMEAQVNAWEKQVNNQAWKDCKTIAAMICKAGYEVTSTANHYLNPKTANPKTVKKWKKEMTLVAVVGNHNFYRAK
jgi:spore germination cell wall hydrolase CwlJ-like protein